MHGMLSAAVILIVFALVAVAGGGSMVWMYRAASAPSRRSRPTAETAKTAPEQTPEPTSAGPDAPELVKVRPYFDHPLFVEMFAESLTAAAKSVPAGARLVFTAHSVPLAADRRCGPQLYSRQVAYAARLVAAAASAAGASLDDIALGLADFRAVPGRLQLKAGTFEPVADFHGMGHVSGLEG